MTELEINQYVSLGRTKPSSTSLKDRILNFSEGRGLRTFFFQTLWLHKMSFFWQCACARMVFKPSKINITVQSTCSIFSRGVDVFLTVSAVQVIKNPTHSLKDIIVLPREAKITQPIP